ncbi:MAG: hypothetical protein Q8R12_04625 [bacterium]|nr:hypothetical protein [bacterium]
MFEIILGFAVIVIELIFWGLFIFRSWAYERKEKVAMAVSHLVGAQLIAIWFWQLSSWSGLVLTLLFAEGLIFYLLPPIFLLLEGFCEGCEDFVQQMISG